MTPNDTEAAYSRGHQDGYDQSRVDIRFELGMPPHALPTRAGVASHFQWRQDEIIASGEEVELAPGYVRMEDAA